MYRIIGADGREYGPISADQLRQWIAEGRANGQTKVLAEGATEWKLLGELPEFAPVTPAAPAAMPAGMVPLSMTPALAQVNGPAIGLIVTAILGFLLQAVSLVWHFVGA